MGRWDAIKKSTRNANKYSSQSSQSIETESTDNRKRKLSETDKSNDVNNITNQKIYKKTEKNIHTVINHTTSWIKTCSSIDKYEILNKIEEGSYGIVSRGRDTTNGDLVAIKKIKINKEVTGSRGFPLTALREIRILNTLKHKHIINLRQICVSEADSNFAISSGLPYNVYLVMDFVEHDVKQLLASMKQPFVQSEVKTLMIQLLSAVSFMHSNWIIHRDLKTSNLLLDNKGNILIADFGLARYTGKPSPKLTPVVVTLWYRAPELLLGEKSYTSAIDMWSVGCIFIELCTCKPLIPGDSEIQQIFQLFSLVGFPDDISWPGYHNLPHGNSINKPSSSLTVSEYPTELRLKKLFSSFLSPSGINLLSRFLSIDPSKRITAAEALKHPYFTENPLPKPPEIFPTFPSKSKMETRANVKTPEAPKFANKFDI